MTTKIEVIDIGVDFTRFPAGRTKSDGPYSGEHFRNQFLRPLIDSNCRFRIKLDGALGYGSSFLEEAFGGLIRDGCSKEKVKSLMQLETADAMLEREIYGYIDKA